MHPMIAQIVRPHWQKGAESDMQGNGMDFHPPGTQGSEDPFGKVQTGGRRRHRSGIIGKDRLIALAIEGLFFSPDIGRKRNAAGTFKRLAKIAGAAETNRSRCRIALGQHEPVDFPQAQAATDADRFRSAGEAGPDFLFARMPAYQENFNFPTRLFHSLQAGRNNPRIVDHQQIARNEIFRDFREGCCPHILLLTMQNH